MRAAARERPRPLTLPERKRKSNDAGAESQFWRVRRRPWGKLIRLPEFEPAMNVNRSPKSNRQAIDGQIEKASNVGERGALAPRVNPRETSPVGC